MKVVVTDEAEADLEAIGDWIARDSPRRAATFVGELRRCCMALATAPRRNLVPRYEHTGVRRRPYGDYLIFYRVSRDSVEILHVLHGARDCEAILFPEG